MSASDDRSAEWRGGLNRPHQTKATLIRPPRDLRLDILRGWMQVSIFVAHCAGSVMAWGIHAAWGVSDSSEQFVLLSGLLLGSVFTLKAARSGVATARADILTRTVRLWRTHLLVFLLMAAFILGLERTLDVSGEALRLGWGFLFEMPRLAIPAAAAMLYQPAEMGILPVFVACMALLAPFLWLVERIGAWALLPSLLLYGAAQLGWAATPGIASGIAFDPLAWQLIFMIGAFAGRRGLLTGRAAPRHPALIALAALALAAGLWARMIDEGVIAGPAWAALAVQGKEVLAPARLLHALALAYLCAVLIPREAPWMRNVIGHALALIGRHSLQVFCVGLFLSEAVSVLLRRFADQAAWIDPVLVLSGAVAMALFAQWLEARRPPVASALRAG
ncbi:OpgC domain-containing protein [Plastoroseomonas hellenica]|uniref:OpgC domain-containing protein n=1 Tax=Plastoroseomonas hellenica TaxID=2687306 RepID=UPI001BAC1A4B|nr:OpgC domain-containing protein [Plastoroseomonas hellenica]MBR0646252.1 succinyl transferase OpgC [Plastoroseomonas hellenica]